MIFNDSKIVQHSYTAIVTIGSQLYDLLACATFNDL